MRKLLMGAVLSLGLLVLHSGVASAQTSDTATVTYEVQAVTLLDLTGSASVTIDSGTVGVSLTDDEDTSGVTYAITNNAGTDSKKLVGSLSAVPTSPTTLSVNVSAPSGATSVGYLELTTSAQDLVTGIDNLAATGVGIAFKLHSTVDAGIVSSTNTTFTLTIVGS